MACCASTGVRYSTMPQPLDLPDASLITSARTTLLKNAETKKIQQARVFVFVQSVDVDRPESEADRRRRQATRHDLLEVKCQEQNLKAAGTNKNYKQTDGDPGSFVHGWYPIKKGQGSTFCRALEPASTRNQVCLLFHFFLVREYTVGIDGRAITTEKQRERRNLPTNGHVVSSCHRLVSDITLQAVSHFGEKHRASHALPRHAKHTQPTRGGNLNNNVPRRPKINTPFQKNHPAGFKLKPARHAYNR